MRAQEGVVICVVQAKDPDIINLTNQNISSLGPNLGAREGAFRNSRALSFVMHLCLVGRCSWIQS
eukprot:3809541-Amphidinium_carterae.1